MLDRKLLARRIFLESLKKIDVCLAVARHITVEDDCVLIAGSSFPITGIRNVVIIAVGKAATPMYEAAVRALQQASSLFTSLEAIVIAPQPPAHTGIRLQYFCGGHPSPTDSSYRAAEAVLTLLATARADTLVIFLISGGSSSMMELPLDSAITLDDFAAFNQVLVGSGLPITEINSLRKHISAVKGGRLAEAAAPAMQATLIISDVPGDRLDVVGSGPSLPDPTARAERVEIYRRLRGSSRLPASVERFFASSDSPETPKTADSIFDHAVWISVLSSHHLAEAAASTATAAGLRVEVDNTCDDWSSADAAQYLLDRCSHLQRSNDLSCLISVGEITVAVTGLAGLGGRNQHFALECALKLAEQGSDITLLSAGSDGIDGNSIAAGAVADGDTCRRAALLGISASRSLSEFNSFDLFHALGDSILTGPTGNNLRDLRILLG